MSESNASSEPNVSANAPDRIQLNQDDKQQLQTVVNDLNTAKISYATACLNFERVEAQFRELERKHKLELVQLSSNVDLRSRSLQELSEKLLVSYNINLAESWTLNAWSGDFTKNQPATAPATAETSPTAAASPPAVSRSKYKTKTKKKRK